MKSDPLNDYLRLEPVLIEKDIPTEAGTEVLWLRFGLRDEVIIQS